MSSPSSRSRETTRKIPTRKSRLTKEWESLKYDQKVSSEDRIVVLSKDEVAKIMEDLSADAKRRLENGILLAPKGERREKAKLALKVYTEARYAKLYEADLERQKTNLKNLMTVPVVPVNNSMNASASIRRKQPRIVAFKKNVDHYFDEMNKDIIKIANVPQNSSNDEVNRSFTLVELLLYFIHKVSLTLPYLQSAAENTLLLTRFILLQLLGLIKYIIDKFLSGNPFTITVMITLFFLLYRNAGGALKVVLDFILEGLNAMFKNAGSSIEFSTSYWTGSLEASKTLITDGIATGFEATKDGILTITNEVAEQFGNVAGEVITGKMNNLLTNKMTETAFNAVNTLITDTAANNEALRMIGENTAQIANSLSAVGGAVTDNAVVFERLAKATEQQQLLNQVATVATAAVGPLKIAAQFFGFAGAQGAQLALENGPRGGSSGGSNYRPRGGSKRKTRRNRKKSTRRVRKTKRRV